MPKDERQKLVAELFEIITGRVKDFVFKHDSVRTIQCALKYASPAQRKMIANELRGEYRTLAESRYSKFLVGKILVEGDEETREMVISEFYGHVRRLINHPEASWILDDTYRGVATRLQKATLLREWYGPEFALLKTPASGQQAKDAKASADLPMLLDESPEKRRTILRYLFALINQLVQKKLTGFTMLHDAMLQYSLAIAAPSSTAVATESTDLATNSQQSEFLDLLKPSEEEDLDLMKNLAFTPSGARVVARALAMAPSAKDRKLLLRPYKDHIETMACDANGTCVLLAAMECVDDTVMLSKLIYPELLGAKTVDEDEKTGGIVALANHMIGRLPLLWALASTEDGVPRRLINADFKVATIVNEVRSLRVGTSKKQPTTRRAELAKALLTSADGLVLRTIEHQAANLSQTSFGCQFVVEVLLGAAAFDVDSSSAVNAVVELAAGDPTQDGHIARSVAGCRMLKTLVQGGHFNPTTQTVEKVSTSLEGSSGFSTLLYKATRDHLQQWAIGEGSFVIVALAEDEDDYDGKEDLLNALQGMMTKLETAADEGGTKVVEIKDKNGVVSQTKVDSGGGNRGARILVNALT